MDFFEICPFNTFTLVQYITQYMNFEYRRILFIFQGTTSQKFGVFYSCTVYSVKITPYWRENNTQSRQSKNLCVLKNDLLKEFRQCVTVWGPFLPRWFSLGWASFCVNSRRGRRLENRSGFDSKESIPPTYVAWQAGTTNRVVVPARQDGNRFLGSLKGLQIRAPVSVTISIASSSRALFLPCRLSVGSKRIYIVTNIVVYVLI